MSWQKDEEDKDPQEILVGFSRFWFSDTFCERSTCHCDGERNVLDFLYVSNLLSENFSFIIVVC